MNWKEFLVWNTHCRKGVLESTDIYVRFLTLLKHVKVFRSLLEKEANTFSSNNATCIFQQPKTRKRLPL